MNPSTPIHLFRLPSATTEQLLGLAVVLLGIILLLSAWHISTVLADRRVRRRLIRHRAADRAAEKRLNAEETALLERMTIALGALPGIHSFADQASILSKRGVSPALLQSLKEKLGFDQPLPSQRLFSTRECLPGQDVSLTDAQNAWKAGILSVDDDALVLKVPPDAARTLTARDVVKVSFWRDLDARYFFLSRVLGVSATPAPVVRLEHPARLERFQDREFYRADVHWHVHLTKVEASAWKDAMDGRSRAPGKSYEGTLIDISPGGFRLAPLPGLAPEDHLVVALPSSDQHHPLTIHARVIAIESDGVRCEFLNLTLREQDLIHHEILQQRRAKKER